MVHPAVATLVLAVVASIAPQRADAPGPQGSPAVLTGRVVTPRGLPAPGAVVVSSAGGRAVAAADGSFELAACVPHDARAVELTAHLASPVAGPSFSASSRVRWPAPSPDVEDLVLLPVAPCDPGWIPFRGGATEVGGDGPIRALAVHDDGSGPALYAGGDVRGIGGPGGTLASGIAEWDGVRWTPLGSGLTVGSSPGSVHSLAVHDDKSGPALYVGGTFTAAGGVSAQGIARWDGSSWSAVGSGLLGEVRALAVFDDGGGPALYAGGSFAQSGSGTSLDRVARWDGTDWSPLGTGVRSQIAPASVNALAVFDDGAGPALYAGGYFLRAGDVAARRIARWDGSTWSSLGDGLRPNVGDGAAWALAVWDGALFVGGDFELAGGLVAPGIARWDGASWSALGSGIGGSSDVSALAVFDDGAGSALYAAGGFTVAGGVAANRVARWDGASWSPLGEGLDGWARALLVHEDEGATSLLAGGSTSPTGPGIPHIGRFGCQKVRPMRR